MENNIGIDYVVIEVGPSHAVLLFIRYSGKAYINVYTTEAVNNVGENYCNVFF